MYIGIGNSTGAMMLQTMLYLANQTSNTLYDFPPAPKGDMNDVKCYGVYGCFPINGVWTSHNRQINVYPQSPKEIDPHFTLYNRKYMKNPVMIDINDVENMSSLGINPFGKLYFIVHGYLEAGNNPWLIKMAKAILNNDPDDTTSVVLIDWGGGSSPPYVQAVANIRLVGAITANLIYTLYEELQMPDLDRVHLIGHSLGSHLSGYAGYYLQKDFNLILGRITGMDPAAPLFTETNSIVRLDRSDAKYVDVIHTDANPLTTGGLGIVKRIGHVDFYPNGGFDNPGCDLQLREYMEKKENSFFYNVQQWLGCNHVRSHQFMTESFNPKFKYVGVTCDSFENFKEGKCAVCGDDNHFCMELGVGSYKSYKKLLDSRKISEDTPMVAYLMTGDRRPFAMNHYKITVRISNSDESTIHGGEIGKLAFKLNGKLTKTTEKIRFSNEPIYFEPGTEFTKVVPGHDLRDASYATVYWEYQTNLLNPLTWRILSSPRIFIEYVKIYSIENQREMILCPPPGTPLLSGSKLTLNADYCE